MAKKTTKDETKKEETPEVKKTEDTIKAEAAEQAAKEAEQKAADEAKAKAEAEAKAAKEAEDKAASEALVEDESKAEAEWNISKYQRTLIATKGEKKITIQAVSGKGMGVNRLSENEVVIKLRHDIPHVNAFKRRKAGTVISNNPIELSKGIEDKIEKEYQAVVSEREKGTLALVEELLNRVKEECPFTIEDMSTLA